MENSKSSMLRSGIPIVMFFIMSVGIIMACGSENNIEFINKYKVDVEKQTNEFYVNDFANIFSEEDKQSMIADALEFAEKYNGIQVVVTTVNSLNGNEIEQYAYSMYEQYEIGEKSMGILILLSVEDREVKIETGKAMQAYITDSKSGQLLDQYGMDYFREDKFAEGLKSVQQAVIQKIASLVPINWNGEEENEMASSTTVVISPEAQYLDSSQNKKEKRRGISMIFAVLSIIEMAIIAILLRVCRKNKVSNNTRTLTEIINQITIQNSELSEEIKKLNNEIEQTRADKEQDTQTMKSQYEQTCRKLNEQINNITQDNRALKKRITEIEEFYDRVSKLHPEHDFEKEVEAMIEAEFIATVESLNEQIREVTNIPADKGKIEMFRNVINTYEEAESDVRRAVTADIDTVRKLYQKSINLQKRAEDIAEARKIDEMLNTVIALSADRNNIQIFGDAIKEYDEAGSAKPFITANVSKVRSLYQESIRLRKAFEKEQQELRDKAEAEKNQAVASRAEENAQRAIRYIDGRAEEDDRDNIAGAFRYYKSLSTDQKKYFSPELLNKMKRLRKEAEDDSERKKRKKQVHHCSDDFSVDSFNNGFGKHSSEDSNHHSGFGGHSSGGGASRHF